ncbi:MAG: TetR family transcriptional regulator [Bryobacterales bacterium]|nr:TetR family transcriptional regulator [Bryobacterales bacterium]
MPSDTKDRILDSAEILFAQNGFSATSLRAITDHADVNLASVNYHFQSKDALVQAVLMRRLNPVNQRRLEMLNAILQRFPASPPPVEEILEAFYRPVVEEVMKSQREGRPIMPLIGRIFIEPGELVASQVRSLMSQVVTAFVDAFHLALPQVPPAVLFWRLQFAVGMMSHTFAAAPLIEGLSRGRIRINDTEEVLRQLIAFAAGGLRGAMP